MRKGYGKYEPRAMLVALRHFAKARREALDLGLTDNGGAIHSVERILDIISLRLRYPHLSHINNLKLDDQAEMSDGARTAKMNGEKILIEHVVPQRAYACEVCRMITEEKASDDELLEYIMRTYRLVLLSEEETKRLNKVNRSRIDALRLQSANIKISGGVAAE